MDLFEELRRGGVSHLQCGWAAFSILTTPTIIEDGSELDGVTDFEKRTITVSSKLDYAAMRHTLLHEIWHVLLEGMWMHDRSKEYGAMEGIVPICNEDLAENIAKGTLLFRNLNPQLWSILFSPHQ